MMCLRQERVAQFRVEGFRVEVCRSLGIATAASVQMLGMEAPEEVDSAVVWQTEVSGRLEARIVRSRFVARDEKD